MRFLFACYFCLLGLVLCPQSLLAAPVPNTARIGLILEPPHLDPTASAAEAIDSVVYGNVFEGLTRIDAKGEVQPCLAASWKVSADYKHYTFTLHKKVTFHNGKPFTSKTVLFSLNRARSAKSINAQKRLFSNIDKLESPSSYTVDVTLKNPDSQFPWKMAQGDAVMVEPKSSLHNKTHPIGTGRFSFVNWKRGQSIKLQRYAHYWGTKPRLDSVIFKFISDPFAQVAALKSGSVDAFPRFSALESIKALKKDSRFQVIIGTTQGEVILALNHRNPLFQDPRIRIALAHALDKQMIIKGAMQGYGTPIAGPLPPTDPNYKDWNSLYPYDAKSARDALKSAGYKPGQITLRLVLPPPAYAHKTGDIVAALLEQIGIHVKIVPIEWSGWLSTVFKKPFRFDMTIVAHTEPNDIDIYARKNYYFGYHSDKVSKWVAQLNKADKSQRSSLLTNLQDFLAHQQPNIFLFELPKIMITQKNLKGLWENAPIQATVMSDVYWDGPRLKKE